MRTCLLSQVYLFCLRLIEADFSHDEAYFQASWKKAETKPDGSWPRSGCLEFENYTTRYRPGLELVLKGINCVIKDGEKVSVRTILHDIDKGLNRYSRKLNVL